MRIGFVEWPEGLVQCGAKWRAIADEINSAKIDMLVTNELPFGRWIADAPVLDPEIAAISVKDHCDGLRGLAALKVSAIVSSRPVLGTNQLKNEAFALERGCVLPLHNKRYFPSKPGWYEEAWYQADANSFSPSKIGAVSVGALLCTDAMFNEHARDYGKKGVELIAIPRAAGLSTDKWLTAGKMAAMVSGCYVVSSNRVGQTRQGTQFGGCGFAFHPNGALISVTTTGHPLQVIEFDSDAVAQQKSLYPCYVRKNNFVEFTNQ